MANTDFKAPNHANAYIPMAEAALQSNYTNNESDFTVNSYVTVAKVQTPQHYDTFHNPDDVNRMTFTDGRDKKWADGADAPLNFVKRHKNTLYTAERYAEGFVVGDVAAATGAWDILADHASGAAESLMVQKTGIVLTQLTTSGTWGSANTATAASLGGQWSSSSTTQNYIQKGIQSATMAIMKSSNRTVNPANLVLIVSPTTAVAMSQTAEIKSYLGNSPFAKEFLQGNGWAYGLGPKLYGIDVIVETAVYNSAKDGLTPTNDFILGDSAILVQRPNTLQGPLNTMSTVTLGTWQPLSITMEHQTVHKRTLGVVDEYYSVIVRPSLGYLIQDVLA